MCCSGVCCCRLLKCRFGFCFLMVCRIFRYSFGLFVLLLVLYLMMELFCWMVCSVSFCVGVVVFSVSVFSS